MRKVMPWTVLVLALAMVPTAGTAQEEGRRGMRPPAEAQQRRAELERQIRQQFLAQLAVRLDLTREQRGRLVEVLEEGAEARRVLAAESRQLRHDLMTAVRDEDAPMAVYEELLAGLREVRERERSLEEREATSLSAFLDARQQAMFLMMRMQLNERVRRMQGFGRGGPGGGGGAGLY